MKEKTHDLRGSSPTGGFSEEERKKHLEEELVRKIDWRLVPWLSLLYLVSFLDRSNMGNAKVEGLSDDLGLKNTQYNDCLTIFFVSYSVFEPFSNILLKKIRPRIYLSAIITIWGLVMTFMGFVHNYTGLMIARWFLGLAEAGLFPGVNYYLSCWYKRREFGVRAAIFFSAAAVSGSFGGLLAAAISQLDGKGGKHGWAWIFILEGAATVLIGIASFWMVYDFPDTATFLTEEERARTLGRLREDQQHSAASSEGDRKANYIVQSISDWKTWVGSLIYMGVAGSLYAFSLFLPSIIHELGYSSTKAQLMSVPPYVLACILTVIVGRWADSINRRGIFNIVTPIFSIIGFTILLVSKSPALSYVATFLAALGIYPCISNTITWLSNNVEGVYKRGFSLGIMIGWGNLNGIMGSNVYRSQDAPRYRLGHSVVLGYLTVCLFGGSLLNYILLRLENARRMRGDRDHWINGKTEEEIELLGDRRPDFLYTL